MIEDHCTSCRCGWCRRLA